MPEAAPSPAQIAACETQALIEQCIDANKHFLVQAGAGSGKTYSLVDALRYIVKQRGRRLVQNGQKVACITYTNVATEEISSRTDRHAAVFASTIHAFCWSLIRAFQPALRKELAGLDKWPERISEGGAIDGKLIEYNLGYPKIEQERVLLGHSDVLKLMVRMMELPKFRQRMADQFPIVFIDEYQDTDRELAESLKRHILDTNAAPLIGLFGDDWQKIYPAGCGLVESPHLSLITKKANFRSAPAIVRVLNQIRKALPQEVDKINAAGSAVAYHTNDWSGPRMTETRWEGDLPPEVAAKHLEQIRRDLEGEGWDFSPQRTKILMLTHRVLAGLQGYSQIVDVFEQSESYVEKKDPHIAFLLDVVEPMCRAFSEKRFGLMFQTMNQRTPVLKSHAEKAAWANDFKALVEQREAGTVGSVIDLLRTTNRPRPSEAVELAEDALSAALSSSAELDDRQTRLQNLRGVPYRQVMALAQFVEDKTPFSTKHGVKGAQFENVLVVVGKNGWNLYNFGQYLEWEAAPEVPAKSRAAHERNRNLFYVACSRPQQRLAVLFVQRLSSTAIGTLQEWFGSASVRSLKVDA